MRTIHLATAALFLAAAACSAHGGADSTAPSQAADGPTDVQSDALLQSGVERNIPIAYYVLRGPGQSDDVADSDIRDSLDHANAVWRNTGVQYYLGKVSRLSLSVLHDTADIATVYTWEQIAADAQKLVPGIKKFGDRAVPKYVWLNQLAARMPFTSIPLFVLKATSCDPTSPASSCAAARHHDGCPDYVGAMGLTCQSTDWKGWSLDGSHGLLLTRGATPGKGLRALAHELGHYFGLFHTFDLSDASTQIEGDRIWEYYDLVFDKSQLNVKPFASKQAAYDTYQAAPGNVTPLDSGAYTVVDINLCDYQAKYGTKSYTVSANPGNLYGLFFKSALSYEAHGVNAMAYLTSTEDANTRACTMHFSMSQIQLIQKHIREQKGKRHLLGAGSFPGQHQVPAWGNALDFDGDGNRDLALFRRSSESCLVRKSSNGDTMALSLAGLIQPFDTPIAADFDGDGRTDCGTYRPNFDGYLSHWTWRSAATGAVSTADFGASGDIPLPGLKLPNASTPSVAVYRPASGEVCWQTPGTFRCVQARQYQSGFVADWTGIELLPGLYDSDGLTDFATWSPTGVFELSLSSCDYQASCKKTLFIGTSSRDTAYSVQRGVDKDGNGQLDLALWNPANGNWTYVLNPASQSTVSYVQWGAPNDIPIGGYDFDLDGHADEAVYRLPSQNGGSNGVFLIHRSTDGSYIPVQGGSFGDHPFATRGADGRGQLWLLSSTGQSWSKYDWATSTWELVSQWGDFGDDVF